MAKIITCVTGCTFQGTTPAVDVTILSVATDDPLHYVFSLVVRQPPSASG